jgi:cytochrome P450
VDLDPIPQVTQSDPYSLYRELRDHHPVYRIPERDLWVVSRYKDIQTVLRMPEHFSSAQGVVPNGYAPEASTIITSDPPAHTPMRKTVSRAFTPKRMAELEPMIRRFAHELVESLPDDGEIEAIEEFCDALPYMVMAELLGLEEGDREVLQRCGQAIVAEVDAESMQAATLELTDHLAVSFVERRRQPRDDLISVLLTDSPEGDAMAEEELLGLCFLLTVAGTETTTSGIGNALVLLDHHRDDRARLIADPSLLVAATDEILRYESPVQGLCRVATEAVEIGGAEIPEGARIHMLFASANRDPQAFPEPERFDITRDPNPHMAFGFGIHRCLGTSLARTEIRVGLDEFLRRFPDYQVAEDRAVRMPSDTNRGFARLPVKL